MHLLLGLAAIIGAFIMSMDLYEAYSALNKLSSYGLFGKMITNNPEVQNKMLMHTLGAGGLWILGIGLIIYHFAPNADEGKSAVVSGVTEPSPASAPVVAVQHSDTRECPHCAEIIKAAAKLCRYCHSAVEPVSKAPVVHSPEIPVLTVRPAVKTPAPNDFTRSVGGVTVSKPIDTSSKNAFSHFARRH
jgi:hypothetical protein